MNKCLKIFKKEDFSLEILKKVKFSRSSILKTEKMFKDQQNLRVDCVRIEKNKESEYNLFLLA